MKRISDKTAGKLASHLADRSLKIATRRTGGARNSSGVRAEAARLLDMASDTLVPAAVAARAETTVEMAIPAGVIETPAGPDPTPVAPAADAGPAKLGVAGDPITLDGSDSEAGSSAIASSVWTVDGSTIATGLTPTVTFDAAGSYTVTLTLTDANGLTDSDTVEVTVTASTVTPESTYLTYQNVPEGRYLDYSESRTNPVERSLLLDVGCDIYLLYSRIDFSYVVEPDANIDDIMAAVRAVAARPNGGVVWPKAATTMDGGALGVELEDRVCYDGGRIGEHIVSGAFSEVVQAHGKRDFAVLNVTTRAVNGSETDPARQRACYGFRATDCVNYLVQGCTFQDHGQNSIDLGTQSRHATVRYNTILGGRNLDGGRKAQHGIVSKSIGDGITAHPDPSPRFGIVYSYSIAIYSNVIRTIKSHAIDSHASNEEVCGNWMDDVRYGCKFPHSTNVLVHDNRFGGSRDGDPWDIRWFWANEYWGVNDPDGVGIGYDGSGVFCFRNRFDNQGTNPRTIVRIEHVYAKIHMLFNYYKTSGTRLFFGGPRSSDGVMHVAGQDVDVDRAGNLANGDFDIEETDPDLLAIETNLPRAVTRMVEIMNAEKNQDWDCNTRHPVPPVMARV